jgi:hypothetical protein
MSLLPSGIWINPNRAFWVQDDKSIDAKALTGISSINGAAYPPPSSNVSVMPSELSTLSVNALTISSINGSTYPPLSQPSEPIKTSGPTIQSGSMVYQGFPTEVYLETPYTSTMHVFLQPTMGGYGIPPDGLFYPTTSGSLSNFTVNSTGSNYGTDVYWLTSGY